MNVFLRKYILLIFLIANVTAEHYMFSSISKIIFYASLALGLLACLLHLDKTLNGLKAAPSFILWSLIYIIYLFTAGAAYNTETNLLYLIAKITSFGIMALCISSYHEYYLRTMAKPMGYLIIFLLILGFNYISYGGGRSYGFFNGNAGCLVAMYGASCFLFLEKMTRLDKFCLLFCLLCVVIGHSRNSLAMLFILVLFRYRLSFKLMSFGLLGAIVIFIVLPYFGIEVEAVTRVMGTFDGTVALDREENRAFAMEMIKHHPYDGWGFDYDDFLLANDEKGSHNGYLSVLTQMGYYFGGAWLVVLLFDIISKLKFMASDDLAVRRHFAIVVAVLFGATNESFLTGVNQIITNLFFVSLMTISLLKVKPKKKMIS